eukprot:CAMPEP_0174716684 /NCGR_PEP_ID=MMETSP1094-20130205/24396_1 /TAXON_ID=156173 /ORGANISM="Chrysochromulina brevifilum, Strain UTEX LB 985" /LENGTH=70 /DNA_ID=CAMNT_0015916477 /DNA_START=26 /DNA_END=234 /DNA_ORIENTATION=+
MHDWRVQPPANPPINTLLAPLPSTLRCVPASLTSCLFLPPPAPPHFSITLVHPRASSGTFREAQPETDSR